MNFFGIFGQKRDPRADRQRATAERLQQYARYLRAYQGFSVRGILTTSVVRDWKRIKFNFSQPVVNLSAGWFAAKPIDWEIDGDPDATKEAYRIWDRSGSDAALLENAICCGIYGDIVGLATQDDAGKAKIQFVDPSICGPLFDGNDYSQLVQLEIAYESLSPDGESVVFRREIWGPTSMETYEGDTLVGTMSYEQIPAVWIRNSAVKGQPFGVSDVEPILELVEEYDHVAAKQTRIVDYYSTPCIVFSGVQKGQEKVEKGIGTVFYLPTDASAAFLEWSGGGPDTEAQLTRIRNAIAEISQVPAVAFGQADSGLTSISGVAIQILYGPLISKTHRKQACWSPALQYLMWLCLRASGFADLEMEAVNVRFPAATPVDGQQVMAEASAKVADRLTSRRTVMNDLGIENPDAELKKIIIEEKMLQLTTPAAAIAQDANTAARAGAKGTFAEQVPAGVGANKPPTVGDTTSTNDDDIAHLIERYDALVAAEQKSLEADEAAGSL